MQNKSYNFIYSVILLDKFPANLNREVP
jgi:hypothetical protein